MEDSWLVELPGRRQVQLVYWGRWLDGRWWAYLWWWAPAEPFRPAEAELEGQVVLCCGWAWSTTIRPLPGVDYVGVPRVDLPAAPDSWPDPAAEWAAVRAVKTRPAGLMGHPLGPRVESAPDDVAAARRRPRDLGSGETLAQRAQRSHRP